MWAVLGIAVLILGLALIAWATRRLRSQSMARPADRRAVVSSDDATAALYPYVFVSDRGSVRELHASEKQLLETPFHPLDAGRPCVKRTYDQKDRRGSLSGYCPRAEIPRRMRIGYPPIERPAHPGRDTLRPSPS
jgi:hypothetical protein